MEWNKTGANLFLSYRFAPVLYRYALSTVYYNPLKYTIWGLPNPIRKGQTYVLYQYGRIYKPDKRYAVPQRTIIGKVNPDGSNTIYPNEHFQEYFPLAVLPEELLEAYRSCALGIGAYAVMQKVLEDYKIPQILPYFGKDSGLILNLVSYMLVDEEIAGQHYPDFAFILF